MPISTASVKRFRGILFIIFIFFAVLQGIAQSGGNGNLEKMPADLETDYALSALPPHLRSGATVYLLDPQKGYYIGRQGTNGFICFVSRTEWQWEEFRNDLATPISYDAEGARSIFPVYQDVATMRASGKYNPAQVKDSIKNRILNGYYKAPARPGISYMLSPLMRVYPGTPDNKTIVTASAPHYMFYAPYVANGDLGLNPDMSGPILNASGQQILGEHGDPYGYIIMFASDKDKNIIVKDGQELMKRLSAYKSWFAIQPEARHHGSTM
ncbi:MAG TPA: hypothetical protein VFE04_09375 [Puia sp.]|nr:hypothetical protein [Puia sp.]